MKQKVALITGVTGQDGAYLAKFLLDKGYQVHGIRRRASMFNTGRIEHLVHDPHEPGPRFELHYADLTDSTSLIRVIEQVQPDELYNWLRKAMWPFRRGARVHGQHRRPGSFAAAGSDPDSRAPAQDPLLPGFDVGAVRAGARDTSAAKRPRFTRAVPTELPSYTPTGSRSIIAKHTTVRLQRDLVQPRIALRGETFVTAQDHARARRIRLGMQQCLHLGNLEARRDWGHARDYVEAQWLMLQQERPTTT